MWHVFDRHPIKEFLEEITGVYPQDTDALPDLFNEDETQSDEGELEKQAASYSPMVYFMNEIEDLYERDMPEQLQLELMTGEAHVEHLIDFMDGAHDKQAKISTQAERVRARSYRIANKERLRRAAKKRRRELQIGKRLARKRIGTAAGGYSFVMDAGGGPKKSVSTSAAKVSMPNLNFAPTKQLSSSASAWKLRWS